MGARLGRMIGWIVADDGMHGMVVVVVVARIVALVAFAARGRVLVENVLDTAGSRAVVSSTRLVALASSRSFRRR